MNEGTLSLNQEAFSLLAGFASGNVRMVGDVVQHLPIVQGNKSISEKLSEVLWYSPTSKRKRTDGSAICTKKVKIAKKEPCKSVKQPKTNAKILAENNPHTKILDSEISVENIIPGSPSYIPYKRHKGKGSKGPKLKNTIYDSDMVRTKQTRKLSEMTAEEKKAHDKKARDCRADLHAKCLASTTKDRKTMQGGKALHKLLATKATRKNGAAATPTKPCHNWSIQAICEIKRFQPTVDLLIPLLSFNRVIREVTQDFHYDLHFQTSAILVLQEACDMFLLQLFKSTNLACIHRNCQTLAPNDFYLVRGIWHIAGINLWWK